MNELWNQIPGWSNFLVSNLGNVKSIDRYEPFRGSTRIRYGQAIKKRVLRKYECVGLKQDGRCKTFFIHRLVAEGFLNKVDPDFDIVNHKDSNRMNNAVENLEWCTQRMNIEHAMKQDNWTKGERHGCAKLTEDIVRHIRTVTTGGFRLAKQFDVAYSTIKSIRNRKTWKHI